MLLSRVEICCNSPLQHNILSAGLQARVLPGVAKTRSYSQTATKRFLCSVGPLSGICIRPIVTLSSYDMVNEGLRAKAIVCLKHLTKDQTRPPLNITVCIIIPLMSFISLSTCLHQVTCTAHVPHPSCECLNAQTQDQKRPHTRVCHIPHMYHTHRPHACTRSPVR
jgi:hypothetical protein